MAEDPARQEITGLVLAGGQGRRMGGRDKGLLSLADRPLVCHVIERLAPQVTALIINANRHQDLYAELGWPVLGDSIAGFPGPLAGILAGLEAVHTPWLLVVPCDSPGFPADLARQLLAASADPARIRMACTPAGDQPVFALIPAGLAGSLKDFLASGGRKITDWYARHALCRVHFAAEEAFLNVNTPEDHAMAEALSHG